MARYITNSIFLLLFINYFSPSDSWHFKLNLKHGYVANVRKPRRLARSHQSSLADVSRISPRLLFRIFRFPCLTNQKLSLPPVKKLTTLLWFKVAFRERCLVSRLRKLTARGNLPVPKCQPRTKRLRLRLSLRTGLRTTLIHEIFATKHFLI